MDSVKVKSSESKLLSMSSLATVTVIACCWVVVQSDGLNNRVVGEATMVVSVVLEDALAIATLTLTFSVGEESN